jgi:hypothetical protein
VLLVRTRQNEVEDGARSSSAATCRIIAAQELMNSRTYTPIPRDSFERIKKALQEGGAGDAGVFRMRGVEMLYAFSAEAKCLTVTLQHKPFFVPESAVWNTLERAIEPYLGTAEETSSPS